MTIGATCLAALGCLLLALVAADPGTLHSDEALYATWANDVARGDLLLLDTAQPVDKGLPFLWLLGGTMAVFGDSPWTIQLPNLLLVPVTVVGCAALAHQLAGPLAGVVAAVVLATSPFAILFAGSAFIDPMAVAAGTWALVAAKRWPVWAGVLLALAAATKLHAVAYVPLAAGLIALRAESIGWSRLVRFGVSLALGSAILFGVMLYRVIFGEPWFLGIQLENVGGGGIAAPNTWPGRSAQWWASAQYLLYGPMAVMAAGAVVITLVRRPDRSILLLAGFILVYGIGLTVGGIPTFDRYLLYLLPPLAVLVAAGVEEAVRSFPTVRAASVTVGVVVALALPGVLAARTIPVAGSALHGYLNLCDWLVEQPFPTVVWNHSLSWHLGYCAADSHLFLYWFGGAADITPQGDAPTLIVLSRHDDPATLSTLRRDGWRVHVEATFGDLRVFRIRQD